jgi:hypothetical protein
VLPGILDGAQLTGYSERGHLHVECNSNGAGNCIWNANAAVTISIDEIQDDRCIGLVQRQTWALATTVSMAATTIWPRPSTSPAPSRAWRSRRPRASYAPGSIGCAADKSGAGPSPSLPRSRARAKSVHGVSH